MRTLAIDLSTGRGTIAWQDGTDDGCEIAFANDRKHSGLFFENLQQLLQRFGRPGRIVVGLGPGSYAGTRIAIATASGLQAATGAQLMGLSSLRTFETDAEEYCVIGDARRQSFFFARIARRDCVEGPLLCTGEELSERMQINVTPIFASEAIREAPAAILAYPSARLLARIAAEMPNTLSAAPLEPIYLREPHITQPNSGALAKVER